MSDVFLTRLLRVAWQITQAERGLAVDNDLNIVETLHFDEDPTSDKSFMDFATDWLQRAIESGQTIITNNIITDPSDAPTTNTNFANLRVVVVIPAKDQGAIYLDQHIRNGIIQRDIIDRINQMLDGLKAGDYESVSEQHMLEAYDRLM